MVLLAIVLVLSVIVARAHAGTPDEYEPGYESEVRERPGDWADSDEDVPEVYRSRPRLYVPMTSATVERVVTLAPPIASVIAAAYRAAGLAEDPTRGWRHRSRLASLIPAIGVSIGQNQSWRDVTDPTIHRGIAGSMRASWHLDRLLYDPNEMRIASLDVARRREKRRLAARTIDVYFDWVAARAAADRDAGAVLDAAAKAAELDAMTDGWFSQALAKSADVR